MRHEPNHTCIRMSQCAACAFELGESLAKKKPMEAAKYIWMVVGSENPCDIRRYSFSYEQGLAQLAHLKKGEFKDSFSGGVWTLFKLTRVKKTK